MKENKIIEFLYNNKPSPFTKKTKLIIHNAFVQDEEVVNNLIKDIYKDVVILKYNNYNVCFILGKYDIDIHNVFLTISDDLGYEINVHDGIYINNNLTCKDIIDYIEIYIKSNKYLNMDIADLVICSKGNDYFKLLDIISRSNFTYIYKDPQTIDIIEALFKNNLNVLQTSRVIYLHRNSILNKIDIIYKETGLNIQKFTNAYLMKQIITNHKFGQIVHWFWNEINDIIIVKINVYKKIGGFIHGNSWIKEH